ncbi:MAG: hypothetical protein HP496_08445 [Nitrospira sp.]|nr:hypothetical protein [Nitrospira sp.]
MAKLTVLAWLVCMLMLTAMSAIPASAGSSNIVSVPTLGVQGEGLPGVVNYILVQLDQVASQDGPIIQFNEVNLGGGARVGEEWKEGARRAVRAVLHAVGDNGHTWRITIKNRSATSLTDGMSASAAVAVAIMAACRGGMLRSDVALSGQITPDGRVDVVGGLPVKIEAAANAHYRAIIVPRDQALAPDWISSRSVASARIRCRW